MKRIWIGIAALSALVLIKNSRDKQRDKTALTAAQKKNRIINFFKV